MPLLGAGLVGISRICDYRHHWQDVLVGSIVGMSMAYFAYRQYYPHLGSATAHIPFSPRVAALAKSAPSVDPATGAVEEDTTIVASELNTVRTLG